MNCLQWNYGFIIELVYSFVYVLLSYGWCWAWFGPTCGHEEALCLNRLLRFLWWDIRIVWVLIMSFTKKSDSLSPGIPDVLSRTNNLERLKTPCLWIVLEAAVWRWNCLKRFDFLRVFSFDVYRLFAFDIYSLERIFVKIVSLSRFSLSCSWLLQLESSSWLKWMKTRLDDCSV